MKNYGLSKLYLKARDRLERDRLEKNYQEFLFAGRPVESELQLQREHRFAYEPLISIVVPVYRTPEAFLREMVESVLGQTYASLELCLADGSGDDDHTERILKAYAEKDPRVRYEKLPENLGIAGNTNAALDLASGDYVALLDHDDFLEKHALFEIVRFLQNHRDADMLYTDEDKVTFDSKTYFHPHYKPDFSLDLLRSNNYICHFLVVGKKLLEKAGRYRESFDGAQDYDFIFRCIEAVSPEEICHVPKILYHWRCHEESTAENPESKTYAFESGKRAIEEHYRRTGIDAEVYQGEFLGLYRTRFHRDHDPLISIIIPNKDHIDDLKDRKSVV